tara:strand:- start:3176 stop:3316 length:141 start_codon:yes stop_codon:yes gene_type:complete
MVFEVSIDFKIPLPQWKVSILFEVDMVFEAGGPKWKRCGKNCFNPI